jgi:protein-tyrosine kinase
VSKTNKTLRNAQKQKTVHKKGTIVNELVSDSVADKVAKPESPSSDTVPEISSKKATIRPEINHEKIISRVSLANCIAKPDSILAEQFRKIRNLLAIHNLTQSLRSVLITSCLPEEGKTTVALNLSATIAKGPDNSVILIDADLRRRSLSSLVGLETATGLSDVLEERSNIEEIIIETEIEGLKIIPAGLKPTNSVELVGSIRMKTLIQHLKEKYKDFYIILDSTPIVATSEAHALSQIVDGVIVVIMADKTRRDVVNRELKTINPTKILGVILNCAEFDTSDYYRKYYKHYSMKK